MYILINNYVCYKRTKARSMTQYIDVLSEFISSNSYLPYLAGTVLLCLLLLIVLLVKGKKQRQLKSRLSIVERIDAIGHHSFAARMTL